MANPPVSSTPRGQARRRAFMNAALEVFLAQGLAAASVNDVVRLAGGSLATLYTQFGSKEGLFLAMLEERAEELLGRLAQINAAHLPLAQGLQQMGERFLAAMLTREAVAIYRIVLTEGRTYPDIFRQLQTLGIGRVRAAVRDYIDERIATGEVRAIDSDWAAAFFLEAVRAHHGTLALASPDYALSDEEITASVARSVDMVINGLKAR